MKGGKGISGREGTGCGDLGCTGEEEKASLGYLDPIVGLLGLAPGPLQKFFNFTGKPPGICFLFLEHRYLDLNSELLGDPGVRAPNNNFRTFYQIRAKLLLLLCPPPPFPSSLLLFLKESFEHPKAPHSIPLRSLHWLLTPFISWLCFPSQTRSKFPESFCRFEDRDLLCTNFQQS